MFAEYAIRAVFLFGGVLVLSTPIGRLVQKARMRNRLKARKRQQEGRTNAQRKIDEALAVSFGEALHSGTFLFLDGAIALIAILLTVRTFSPALSLSVGAFSAGIPWIVLRLRLETKRREGSREGVLLLSELLRRYRIDGKNIQLAIENTVPNEELRVTGKLLYRFLLQVRDAKSPEIIRKAGEDFAFALSTNWGNMLAYNISRAAATGKDIGPALEDILIQLRDAEKLAEERKRMNGETARIIRWFLPLLYPTSLFMARLSLEIPWEKLFRNQFETKEGLLLFLAITALWILNSAFLSLVINRKFDF